MRKCNLFEIWKFPNFPHGGLEYIYANKYFVYEKRLCVCGKGRQVWPPLNPLKGLKDIYGKNIIALWE